MPRRATLPTAPVSLTTNLETIARSLGIAVSTVSRALRNHPGIHPTTRLKIQTEAARLGYAVKRRDDDRALDRKDGGVRHLLTLAQSIHHASQQGYLAGISQASQTHDIGVFSHHCSAENAAHLLDVGHQPAALRLPDLVGVIFIHRWPDEVVARIAETRPAVSIIHRYPGLPVDTVSTDDEAGIRLLFDHLLAKGHKRIGFFGFEPSYSWARTRLAMYLGTAISSGLPYDRSDIIEVGRDAAQSYSPADLRDYLPQIRARIKAGVKGWVCSSYVLAQALCGLLRGAGYRVPGDVSVTGIHGGERIQQPGIPHPTSVETDDPSLGAAAVHLLNFRKLRSVPAPSVLSLPVRLVQGDST